MMPLLIKTTFKYSIYHLVLKDKIGSIILQNHLLETRSRILYDRFRDKSS
jgi:hypothetical protein